MKILPSGGLKFGRFERLKWFPVECNEAKSSHEVSDEHSKIFSEKILWFLKIIGFCTKLWFFKNLPFEFVGVNSGTCGVKFLILNCWKCCESESLLPIGWIRCFGEGDWPFGVIPTWPLGGSPTWCAVVSSSWDRWKLSCVEAVGGKLLEETLFEGVGELHDP